ncbi:2-phospho-L-lactate guanylyltransferase [Pseudonocardia spinosispora]|uniref:2-phospho-L-lactate guanylyltransferase n=1 Tax=Pseudonocardia spinosispora TaxID=103441 RepID=UPI00041A18E3|nr:2-phospho-L-lactate guanylyltransferase [Pseudonocardia spinosispora]
MTGVTVDLMIPIKSLSRAKTRLRGAADDGIGEATAHARLALALSRDTVAAARAARSVRRVVAITSDPEVTAVLTADGVPVLADLPQHDLNGALAYGAEVLRTNGPQQPVAALQADLPALRPDELDQALHQAIAAFRIGRAMRAYCADAPGVGTTLLVCAPWVALEPRFGGHSAEAHENAGALPLIGDWPGLRRDVDTPSDLWHAERIGLGTATRDALRKAARPLR